MQVTVVSLFLTGVGMTQFKIVTAGGGRDSSRPCSLIISWVSWIPGLNTSGDQRDHNLRLSPRGFTEYAGHRLRVFQPERAPRTIRSRASSRVKDFGCQRPQACCASGNSIRRIQSSISSWMCGSDSQKRSAVKPHCGRRAYGPRESAPPGAAIVWR